MKKDDLIYLHHIRSRLAIFPSLYFLLLPFYFLL